MQGVIQLRPRFFSLKPSGWPVPGLVSGRILPLKDWKSRNR
jgi:hypothetical protein